MPITKSVSSRACTRHAIDYITNGDKTERGKYVEGILCDPKKAIDEFQQVKQFYDKTDGRQYKHYVLSFDPKADKQPNADEVLEIAEKVVTETAHLQGFQAVVAVHDDREHIHAHIIVNSVSIADGHKLQETKADLQNMKDVQNAICHEYGYEPPIKGKQGDFKTYDKHKYHEVEDKKEKADIVIVYQAVDKARQSAENSDQFIEQLKKQDITTSWTATRQHVVFTYQDKKYRDSNLSKTFSDDISKETLEHEFQNNRRKRTDNEQYNELAKSLQKTRADNTGTQADDSAERQRNSEIDSALEQLSEQARNRTNREQEAKKRAKEERREYTELEKASRATSANDRRIKSADRKKERRQLQLNDRLDELSEQFRERIERNRLAEERRKAEEAKQAEEARKERERQEQAEQERQEREKAERMREYLERVYAEPKAVKQRERDEYKGPQL